MGGEQKLTGPDLAEGVALGALRDGEMLLGHADGEAVLLARRGDEIFAVGATCTHYGGPLAEDCSSATPSAVRGTTRVSTCAPARPCARRR